MKKDLHPELHDCTVTCACGNSFVTKSTKPSLRIDICNECHPFFTGSERMVDTAGRIDKFKKRYNIKD
ncbi:LSU ribosomal protein L31p @ LSU ribosomal protein L31p, zinc-dependent [hydrothermal vent metagenome]|uniref:Large ribosomal subunit protein bL31 n=1 Tax=hydrothermal vent metagenome TaxID=652676 RepID=A0A1W1B8P1_9ZZZZ